MTSKEEIVEILHYTNSVKNNTELFKSQCYFLEELLTSANSLNDSSVTLMIEKVLSDNADMLYSTEKMVKIRLQYASNILYKTTNYYESLELLTELLAIPKIELHTDYFRILLEMGSVNSILSNLDEAKFYFQKAQELSTLDWEQNFRIIAKQATLLYKQHKIQEAVYLLESLLENSATIDSPIIAGVCLTLGTLYSKLQNSKKSIDYFHQADSLRDKEDDEFGIVLYNNLGNLFSRMYDLEKSVSYFEQSLQFAKKTEKKDLLLGSYVNLASIEIQRENYNDAQFLLESAYQFITEVPQSYITLRVNERLAYIYIQSGDVEKLEKAKELVEHTITQSTILHIEDLLTSAYWVYSLYFKSKGLMDLHFQNLMKSHLLALSIQNLFMEFFTSLELTQYYLLSKEKEARVYLEKTEKAFLMLHQGYQESKISTLYLLKLEVALLENKIGEAQFFYNKIVTLQTSLLDSELQSRLLQLKTQLHLK